MIYKIIKLFTIFLIFYQSPLYSKSNSFNDFNNRNLSNYFSGIVAYDNKKNTEALKFFNTSKILLNKHDPYLKRYIDSLVLENKILNAINLVKRNKKKKNSKFFDAYLLLIIDSLKKNNFELAEKYLIESSALINQDRFNLVIFESLKKYIFAFKEKKILTSKKNFGQLTLISETFLRCYLEDEKTGIFFSNLTNGINQQDYARYVFFYIGYLVDNKKFSAAKKITDQYNFLNSTLLLSQGKSWIDNERYKEFNKIFSCKNHNDIVSEFLFLISNLYSSQDNFKKSNFYLNLSHYLNPKFKFNFSLVAENLYLNENYNKAKKVLEFFDKDNEFYHWFRIKKEAQIIAKEKNDEIALIFITSKFEQIKNPNIKMIFDIANFYKNSKEYEKAIMYYSEIIKNLDDTSKVKSDLLYRRGGSFERLKEYKKADEDLLYSLKIDPDDAYALNYLAYSWLERNYKIDEAINMLEKANSLNGDDPYIIDSIGWAFYLVGDYIKAENFLKRAVELMPEDPVVNDHYGDILWQLDRKIQARYFWNAVLKIKDTKQKMKNSILQKLLYGPQET